MTAISLFSGCGISDVGFHNAGIVSVAQVEIAKRPNAVRRRHFPDVQHFDDIRSFDATQFRGVDVVHGGFPCQDYSVAGRRAGLAGDRGALWWEFHRVVREARPQFVVGENVPGLLSSGGFGTIVRSLVELGYCVAWRVLDLQYLGVAQRRRRVFIVGSLGDGRCAQILFEPESLFGDTPPSRTEGKEHSSRAADGSRAGCPETIATLNASMGKGKNGQDVGAYIPELSATLASHNEGANDEGRVGALIAYSQPIAFAQNQRDEIREVDVPGALASEAGMKQQTYLAEPFIWQPIPICEATRGANADGDRPSFGDGPMFALQAGTCHGVAEPIAFDVNESANCGYGPTTNPLRVNGRDGVCVGWRVRRLTPTECERLMGLPDGYTAYGDDGKPIADGPRYTMIGNGWAVPHAEWIAKRMVRCGPPVSILTPAGS
jgi:DNA (cytosine-5)-methyltransferase 1